MTLPLELTAWARRHHVGVDALAELSALLGAGSIPESTGGGSESKVQSEVRLAAAAKGYRFWRNNVGVLKDRNGVPVRYGLANESKALNSRLKSADLIGWRSLQITPQHVGTTVAQFASAEVKHEGWSYRGGDHEEAQARWAALVTASGGLGLFISNAESLPA